MAIPADRNVVQKEAECTIIPIVIGATGIVTRSLKKNLEAVPGKHSIDSLQKKSYTWNITHNTESTAV